VEGGQNVVALHLADAWEAVADAIPDEPALVHGSTRRTWREFDDRSARLAAGLRAASKADPPRR
jgi:fatty-acyl-CoA synthase